MALGVQHRAKCFKISRYEAYLFSKKVFVPMCWRIEGDVYPQKQILKKKKILNKKNY